VLPKPRKEVDPSPRLTLAPAFLKQKQGLLKTEKRPFEVRYAWLIRLSPFTPVSESHCGYPENREHFLEACVLTIVISYLVHEDITYVDAILLVGFVPTAMFYPIVRGMGANTYPYYCCRRYGS